MKQRMAIESDMHAWITYNNHGNIELNVNRLTATLCSNFGSRLQQATAGYKYTQGHGWI